LKLDETGFLDMHVACVTHITENLDGFNPEEIVRKSSVIQMPTLPYTSLARRAPMKSPFFPLSNVLGKITVSTFFLWYGATIAAAVAAFGKRARDDSNPCSPRRTRGPT
jgi:hypothetical protein